MNKITTAIGILALSGVPAYLAAAQQPVADAQGLQQLAKSGSDLEKLHQIDFTLRFPNQKAAERAELDLMAFAFSTKVEPGRTADERVIKATKRMFPIESDLTALREKLDAIAAKGRGSYEGWRARLAPTGN
jgi:hypothetical protein